MAHASSAGCSKTSPWTAVPFGNRGIRARQLASTTLALPYGSGFLHADRLQLTRIERSRGGWIAIISNAVCPSCIVWMHLLCCPSSEWIGSSNGILLHDLPGDSSRLRLDENVPAHPQPSLTNSVPTRARSAHSYSSRSRSWTPPRARSGTRSTPSTTS